MTDLQQSFATAGKPRLTVRFSEAADLPKIMQFYQANQHTHVHIRKPDWIEDHAKRGRFLLSELPDGTLAASSAVYDYVTPKDTDGKPSYYEAGSTNFDQNVGRGLGLYPYYIASQVIAAFLDYPPKELIIANVYDSSPVGRDMLVPKVGWKIITPTQDVLDKFKSTKSAAHTNHDPMTWYGASSDTLPHQARLVLEFMNKAEIAHKKTGEAYELDFSKFSLAGSLRPLVEELATGEFGRHLEATAPLPLAMTRQYLDQHSQGKLCFPPTMP